MNFYYSNSSWLLLVCVTFLWKLDIGSAIVCYDCNSMYDPRCGESFDPYTLGTVNCSLRDPPEGLEDMQPSLCRIIKIEAFGKTRYVRSCGYIRDNTWDDIACRRTSGTHELFTTYCSCSGDLCNDSASKEPALLLIGVAMMIMTRF